MDKVKEKPDQGTKIKIDNDHYDVELGIMSGAQLRTLPEPDIGPDRDLWLERSGQEDDILITDDYEVTIEKNMRFFTAPSQINPGA